MLISDVLAPITFATLQGVIRTVAAWPLLCANMVMRGVAVAWCSIRRKMPPRVWQRGRDSTRISLMRAGLILCALMWGPGPMAEDRLRVATFQTELQRVGPGLLLRDIGRGAEDINRVVAAIVETNADILVLQGVDWDLDLLAAVALARRIARVGPNYPHVFALPQNRGLSSGMDLDGDGRLGGPGDAHGYGAFTGQGAMVILSRYPIMTQAVTDYAPYLWRDLPGAVLPVNRDRTPFPSARAHAMQRLSSSAHWVVPVALPGGQSVAILTYHATPPVFDGPEDRNGLRNRDETLFWQHYLDGKLGDIFAGPVILAGNSNLDPAGGDGRSPAMRQLLAHPRLQDPLPGQPTVDWSVGSGPGTLRVSYVLPDRLLQVLDAGLIWPAPGAGTRHAAVWVDVVLP